MTKLYPFIHMEYNLEKNVLLNNGILNMKDKKPKSKLPKDCPSLDTVLNEPSPEVLARARAIQAIKAT